jgi:polyhydroxyalkanoate synthesis regulator phasin
MVIRNNGDIDNSNNSYGSLSDERLKENIVDARSYMDDICKIKIKKFNFKKGGPSQIGVIAQDIQKIFPSLVTEDLETGNLSVKYSIFNTMLIKCVQEQQETLDTQQTTIETLEADLANTRSTLNAQQTQINELKQQIDDLKLLVTALATK